MLPQATHLTKQSETSAELTNSPDNAKATHLGSYTPYEGCLPVTKPRSVQKQFPVSVLDSNRRMAFHTPDSMKTKLLTSIATVLLSGLSLPAANIAWVSYHPADNTPSAAAAAAGFTNASDVRYTALLAAQGHTVTRFVRTADLQNYPDLMVALNTNNLVIISRSVPSGDFDTLPEAAAWNSSITVPLMALGGYANRGSRLGFVTGETIPDVNSNPMRLLVKAPAHPIFAGVSLNPTNLMVNPYSQRVIYTNSITGATNLQVGISVTTTALVPGGTALATVGTPGDAAFNGAVIAEYPAGSKSQRGDVFAAKRLVFLTGSRESGITGEGSGICDLLADGEKLFLNAVTYMTTPQVPKCTLALVGATNLVAGDTWTFTAGPIGDSPLSFQWYKDGAPITEFTNAVLAFTNLASSDAGAYQLIVTNPVGSATSTLARLDFHVFAPANLTNSIISYWPLDTILGTKTPDLVSGYDMTLVKMGATNVMPGKWGNAFAFDTAAQTSLERINTPGEDLPIYNHPDFTVSLWVNGLPQSDHRVFAEGNLTNTTPTWSLGTHNSATAPDATVDIYLRNDAGAVGGDHRHSTALGYDSTWHHVTYVQRDIGGGSMKAQLFVDGVLDPVVITPVRPSTLQTTAIGAWRRASTSSWFTGMIDEVAAWSRALSAEEVQMLQTTYITNPPTRMQPLAINGFKADLGAVAKGDSTILRWDVSKDATLVTINQLGDVTAQTIVGIGTNVITLNTNTQFVLTVKRGADTLSATTSVAVVQGIDPGWLLLDNFDRYAEGNLLGAGYWIDPHGNSAQVVGYNGNKVLKTTTGDSIVYLSLRDLTVLEGQTRSLFFRMIPLSDTARGITNIVGLTDKSQRGYADEFANIGPVVYLAPFTNDVMGITTNAWYMGARDGFQGNNVSNPIDYPGEPLLTNVIYNVWIDITNASMSDFQSDTFTVYIQKEGETTRTNLVTDYLSDRDLYYLDPVLGGMAPNLDKLVVFGNSATYGVLFDDFYLSKSGYNASVPRPYGYTGPLASPPAIAWSGSQLEIRWASGTLQQSDSLAGPWSDVPGATAPTYKTTPTGTGKYYRTRQ